MKKVKKIIISLIVLLALVFVGLLIFLNPIVAKLKPQIEKTISTVVKQEVKIAEIGASIFPNIGVKLSGLSIDNEGKKEASLNELFLHTGLMQLIKGNLSVDTFTLKGAHVDLLKKKDGIIYLGKFALNPKKKTDQIETKKAPEKKEEKASAEKAGPIKFNLAQIDISGLNLKFTDKSKSPAGEYKVEDFAISAKNIGTSKKGTFTVNGKVLNAVLDINGNLELGKYIDVKSLSLSAGGQVINLTALLNQTPAINAKTNVKTGSFSVEKFLAVVMPNMADKAKGLVLNGLDLAANFDAAKSNANNTTKLGSLNFRGTDVIKDMTINTAVKLNKDNTPKSVVVDKSNFEMFAGNVAINADLKDMKKLSSKINAGGMNLALMSNFAMPDSAIGAEGTIEKADVTSNLNLDDPKNSINAQVNALVKNGAITGINIFGKTLGALKGIPGVDQALSAYIPPEHSALITATGTQFDTLILDSALKGEDLRIKDFSMLHSVYSIKGNGRASTKGTFNIKAKLILNSSVAARMVERSEKLKYIAEADGSIVIPIVILKNEGSAKVLPDMKDLLKRAAKAGGREAAEKAIQKGLDKVAPGLNIKGIKSLF